MTSPTSVPDVLPEEFADRRRRAAAAARAAGLDALLVCSRGGGTLDRYADVFYLTRHYTSFPYIPDLAGQWTGRAHAFLVLPVSGAPTLIADIPSIEQVALPRAEIVVADLVAEATIEAIAAAGLDGASIGLVGADTLPLSLWQALTRALPSVRWRPADDILARLRAVKSPGEIARLKAASRLGSRMLDAMMAAAVPGATHGDTVAAGMQVLIPAGGAMYNSFMASGRGGAAPSIVRASFPTWSSKTPFESGQWFRIGISGVLDGYCFDLSRSRPIGPPQREQVAAFEAAIEVVRTGIAAMTPGATAGQVARAGQRRQEELGYAYKGVFSGLGHGLGLGWDSPWLVTDAQDALQPGMVLSVEKTVMRDGWLGDFEETVVLGADGPEYITDAIVRTW